MELHTLLFLNSALLCFSTVGLTIVYLASPGLRSLRWLALAYGCGTLSTLLLAISPPSVPPASRILLVNTVLLGSYVLLHRAILDFIGGIRQLPRFGIAILLVQLAVDGFFVASPHVALIRIFIFSVLLAAQLGLSSATLLRRMQPGMHVATSLLAFILLAFGAFNVARAAWCVAAWFHPATVSIPRLQVAGLLVMILSAIGILFGFVWMSSERLRLELDLMARTDSLTGVLNRRAFESEFAREVARSLRSGSPLSVLLMDVDHFKFINDLHGHMAGDAVLCELAAILQRDLRRADLVARLGGEEFAALLPDTDDAKATHIAERLRAEIETQQIPVGTSTLTVTASFGVTAWEGHPDAWEALLHRVDSAMYQAKQAGRNRVQTA